MGSYISTIIMRQSLVVFIFLLTISLTSGLITHFFSKITTGLLAKKHGVKHVLKSKSNLINSLFSSHSFTKNKNSMLNSVDAVKHTKPTSSDIQELLKAQEKKIKDISKLLESVKASTASIKKELKMKKPEKSEDQEIIQVNIITELNPFYMFLKNHTGQNEFSLSDLAKAFKILEETDYYSYTLLRKGSYDHLFQIILELAKQPQNKHNRRKSQAKENG